MCTQQAITIMSIIKSERIVFYGVTYPVWATVLGWLFTISSMSAIPIYAIYYYSTTKKTTKDDTNHASNSIGMSHFKGNGEFFC